MAVAVDSNAPTGNLRGAANPSTGMVAPWSSFAAQAREHVPELRPPRANLTYERVLTDAQVWADFAGTVLPIEDYAWWVDPNGNDETRVAMLAEDLGLPVGDPTDTSGGIILERTSLPDEFDFGVLLHEALFALAFGHYYFEWAGEVRDGFWRLTEIAPLHPSTLAEVRSAPSGRLEYVVQRGGQTYTLMGSTLFAGQPPKIGPERLIPFVFWPDATRQWLGRSVLRPLYRNWLCKDVLIRVDVTNHERAGGVPWIETDERYAGQNLEDLQRLAAEFRVDEEGGAALPPGALLRLARAGGSDTIASIRYHDEQMGRVWQTMVRQLGQTATGSRALGDTFSDLEALARRAIAGWAAKTLNRWAVARWWWWNFGEKSPPVIRFTPPALEAAQEVSSFPAAGDPAEGDGGPPPRAATARPSPRRNGGEDARHEGPAGQASSSAPDASVADDVARASVVAAATAQVLSRSRLPDRELRRQPYEHEVAAEVDFAAIEVLYEEAADRLDTLFLTTWLPEHMAAVSDSIVYTRSGSARQRLTAADMARIPVPVVGVDALTEVLLEAALAGAAEAVAELGAQGFSLDVPTEAALRSAVVDHAKAIAQQTADGLRLAVTRRAVQMAGAGLTAGELAAEVVAYVEGLEHAWERDQLSGAVQQALNHGRLHVFEGAEAQATGSPYASELLDAATCEPCRGIDGTTFPSIAVARQHYPSGGYTLCRGGPRCRGMVVMVLAETEFGATTVTP